MLRFFGCALTLGLLLPGAASAQQMPGVNVKDLEPTEVQALATLMREGACPCDPNKSILQCIEAKTCPQATGLATFGADQFRDGAGLDQVREAVVRKYLNDFAVFKFSHDGPAKGAKNGRIKIVEFADFECPHCALMRPVLNEIIKRHPEHVTVYFKQFPLGHHAYSELAARATLAAHKQGRFWPMHDLLFTNQGKLGPDRINAFAAELGLNTDKFKADLESPAVATQIQRDKQEGIDALLTGTPTIYINGRLYLDEKTVEGIDKHVVDLLKNPRK